METQMATQLVPPEAFTKYPMPPRAAIATAVDTLLAVLDALDGDPDLEDGDPAEDDDPGGCPLDIGEACEGSDGQGFFL
jgi:hypothetical protein